MLKLKILLPENVDTITSKDIFNFYFLFSIASYHPELLKTDYGEFVQKQYLMALQTKFIKLFKQLIITQLQKYYSRQRVDKDFDVTKIDNDVPATILLDLMKKTYRSDLIRRNITWEQACEFLVNLENAKTVKDIYIYIDRLNAITHNTATQILGKVSYNLVKAYDIVHQSKSVESYKQFVDKDIRELMNQESLNEDKEELGDVHQALFGEPKSIPSNREKDIRKPAIKFDNAEKNTAKTPKLPVALQIGPL